MPLLRANHIIDGLTGLRYVPVVAQRRAPWNHNSLHVAYLQQLHGLRLVVGSNGTVEYEVVCARPVSLCR